MHTQKAIILRSYFPEKRKLFVLDENLGRLEVVYHDALFIGYPCHGAIINYQPVRMPGGTFLARHAEVMYIPFWLAQHDVLFLHQLLECMHLFCPLEGGASEAFVFIVELYRKRIESPYMKKMVICKLLYLLGIYPDDAQCSVPYLFSLISSSWDIMLNESANERLISDLTTWLTHCISLHPAAHKLKTITLTAMIK